MTLEQDIRPDWQELLPQHTVVAEMTLGELRQSSGYRDPKTGCKLTVLERIAADEAYDDGMYAVGAQGVFLAWGDAPTGEAWLSEAGKRHNTALTDSKTGKGEDYMVAVVSRRPSPRQYKETVALRESLRYTGDKTTLIN